MSLLFALVAVDDAIVAGNDRILVVVDESSQADAWDAMLDTFKAHPAGVRPGEWSDLLVKRPSRNGVTRFVTISFQPWKKTPRWSEYWDCIVCVRSSATLPKDYEKWTEYLADYLSPGGTMQDVWIET